MPVFRGADRRCRERHRCEQFGERLPIGGDIQRRVIEKIVVAKEVAGDHRVGVPALNILSDRFGPGRHELRIVVAVADAVNAENL